MKRELIDNMEYYQMTLKEGNEDDAANTLEEMKEMKEKIAELRRKHQIFDQVNLKNQKKKIHFSFISFFTLFQKQIN